MKIRFVKHHVVKQGDRKGPIYEVGQVYSFNGPVEETYARKYIARGLAVDDASEREAPPRAQEARGPTPVPADGLPLGVAGARAGKGPTSPQAGKGPTGA